MSAWLDDLDDEGSGFCECGVTLDHGETECAVCAAAPHHRECPCDECDAYWAAVEARGRAARTAFTTSASLSERAPDSVSKSLGAASPGLPRRQGLARDRIDPHCRSES